jgi:trimethylamine:corrinoid methyltransferase-like protein
MKEEPMSGSTFVQPRINLLNSEQIEQVHGYALRILATTGVRVDSDAARRHLSRKLGQSCMQDDRVRIPAEWVEWALKTAPSCIDIYDRRGNLAFSLGADRARFGIGVTTLFYQDPQTDELVPFNRSHMREMVLLAAGCPNLTSSPRWASCRMSPLPYLTWLPAWRW